MSNKRVLFTPYQLLNLLMRQVMFRVVNTKSIANINYRSKKLSTELHFEWWKTLLRRLYHKTRMCGFSCRQLSESAARQHLCGFALPLFLRVVKSLFSTTLTPLWWGSITKNDMEREVADNFVCFSFLSGNRFGSVYPPKNTRGYQEMCGVGVSGTGNPNMKLVLV